MTTSTELKNKLKGIPEFMGVFPRDILPDVTNFPASLIINTDTSDKSGEHWVAVYISNRGFGEYFDSYGLKPLYKEFIYFMDKYCPNGWQYNSTPIQGLVSTNCGQYCVVYVFLKSIGFTLCKIVKLFTTCSQTNDKIIEKIYQIL